MFINKMQKSKPVKPVHDMFAPAIVNTSELSTSFLQNIGSESLISNKSTEYSDYCFSISQPLGTEWVYIVSYSEFNCYKVEIQTRKLIRRK